MSAAAPLQPVAQPDAMLTAHFATLHDALLPKLLSGELSVENPNASPRTT